jgi:hypothetical protein
VYIDKLEKYAMIAREVKAEPDVPVGTIPMIISSLGALHEQPLKALGPLLMCEEKEETKIRRRLSKAAIAGPLEIWRG